MLGVLSAAELSEQAAGLRQMADAMDSPVHVEADALFHAILAFLKSSHFSPAHQNIIAGTALHEKALRKEAQDATNDVVASMLSEASWILIQSLQIQPTPQLMRAYNLIRTEVVQEKAEALLIVLLVLAKQRGFEDDSRISAAHRTYDYILDAEMDGMPAEHTSALFLRLSQSIIDMMMGLN